MPLPNYVTDWYIEGASLAVGQEHVLDYIHIPYGGATFPIPYDYVLFSPDQVDTNNVMIADLRHWILPCYGADRTEIPDSPTDIKDLYDRRIVKVNPNAPSTAWNFQRPSDPDNSDQENEWEPYHLGDDDNNLVYQMGRINRRIFADPGEAAMLTKHRERLGFLEGRSFRRGNSDKVHYSTRINGVIPGRIHAAATDIIIVAVLTIPANIQDDDFRNGVDNHAATFNNLPADREWESLRAFLAPQREPILGLMQSTATAVGDALKYMVKWDLRTSGSKQLDQKTLSWRGGMSPTYDRNWNMDRVVSVEG